ncbi:toll/interleukin-1 receptor domain-containing protein [Planctomycetota bacterium]
MPTRDRQFRHPSWPDLFLCHSHRDRRFVRRVARDLQRLAVSVWYAEWELEVGDSLHACIGEALERSAFVGVVLSPDSVASRWCQSELDQALAREKRTGGTVVLPLLYRRVPLPPFLEGRLYLNFSRSYFKALARLVGFLQMIPPRELADRLSLNRPKSIDDVYDVLRDLFPPSSRVRVLAAQKYKDIQDALGRAGVDIRSDLFRVLTHDDTPVLCFDGGWEAERQIMATRRMVREIAEQEESEQRPERDK